jgi:glucose uptake protein
MVGALWGIFAWKEFKGAGPSAKVYLTFMFVFYGLAILLVAHSNG